MMPQVIERIWVGRIVPAVVIEDAAVVVNLANALMDAESYLIIILRCHFCKKIAGVYSPSIWAGWYSGRYTEYRAATEKAIADNQHFFHAEWAADSMAGRHSEEPEQFLDQVATSEGTAEVGKAYKATGGKARASRDGDWSESYAINLFDWTLHEQETMRI
jgi:beta-galactosidase